MITKLAAGLLAAAAVATAPASCDTHTDKPADTWVVLDGPMFSRHSGASYHSVHCVRADLGADGPWREVEIPAALADRAADADAPLAPGRPCPAGRIVP